MSQADPNQTITGRAARGVTWLTVSQIGGTVLSTASMVVLARLLSPANFGLVAIATLFTDAVLLTGDLGFAEAIIRRKQVSDSHLSVTFWTGLGLGVIAWAVIAGLSPAAAGFFKNEAVRPVLVVSALVFVIAPLRIVHGTLLRKQLQFFKLAITDLGQATSAAAVSVVLAFAGFGVWSLVIGSLAGHVTLVILRWVVCRWRPSLSFRTEALKDLWSFGASITGTRLAQYAGQKLDTLVTGRFLSVATLGFYTISYRIFTPLVNATWTIVGRVAFPAFSLVQDEDERLRRGFTKVLSYFSMIMVPLFTGIAIVAPDMIAVLFGPQWAAAVLPSRILCPMGAAVCISVLGGPIFRSKGRPDIEFKLELARVAVLVPALIIGAHYGIAGVATAVSTVSVAMRSVQQALVSRLIGLKTRDYLLSLSPAFAGSAVMALGVLGFRYAMTALFSLSNLSLLVLSAAVGVAIYVGTLKISRTKALDDMLALTLRTLVMNRRSATAGARPMPR